MISLPGSPLHSYATHFPGRRFLKYVVVIILTSRFLKYVVVIILTLSTRLPRLGLLFTPMSLISLAEDFCMHDLFAWVSSPFLCYSFPWPKIFECMISPPGSPLHSHTTHFPSQRFLTYINVVTPSRIDSEFLNLWE
ncbi:uncharacterized protein C8R40DRAFT_1264655 [Lentinula edodes]|uniref:uncharacterized protein n=1 Tax=Lentinula edodes TaxID=5353 RepID=UPI001E8EBC84|nr:uncharacterized protein C8R40DRAFT_1264655 [Lentinula edodes]KAH7876443.1 hypothetical protein C8R40DRAFT_1264655 [Lentinula edodes]